MGGLRTSVACLGVVCFGFIVGPAYAAAKDQTPINLPSQIGERLAQCWQAPIEPPQAIEATVRLSFSRTGAVIGEPRVVYVRAPALPGVREKITSSLLAAIKACTPLPFTPALGAAIAGRMFAIRFKWLPVKERGRLI